MKPFSDIVETYSAETAKPTKNDIIDSTEFHVGIVTIEAGREIRPHPEPYAVFFFILGGAGEFTGEDGTIELSEGDGVFLDHNEQRGIRCTESLTILGIQEAH
ncbi:cupin domain-containing protein [Halodesulfurarchaeum sp.]|uniref:cupin domain-containing protein n=1 Tax=Halodesulfurarchaeum sp. TaxID=1980530 RepID=UPI001BBD88C1|nr:cupin domain-containing protein [Halodesulfurarchaeum sp.]